MVKIGLLAPFEGIYRQEGYDALAAMRAAIAEQNPHAIDVLPLALDSSQDVVRAGHKMMADPSVVAIVGPYWAVDGVMFEEIADGGKWLHPYAPLEKNGGGLVDAMDIASAFARREGRSLVVAGAPLGWPEMAVSLAGGPGDVQVGQTVLWLGDAEAGADFALALWERLPGTPFGLYGAGTETFRQRVGPQMAGPVLLVGWIDEEYEVWAQSHTPNTPAAYTIYRLTADALARFRGETVTTRWQPGVFILGNQGELILSTSQ